MAARLFSLLTDTGGQWVADMETRNSQSQLRALICATVVAYARPFTTSQVTKSERIVASNGMETVARCLEEQAAQIQKVSAQLDLSKTAPQIVLNNQ